MYNVPVQETAKHRAKFGWPPLSDVGALTKPRRETRWNLLGSWVGCPKPANRPQPLVVWSSPYCEDTCRRYCWLFPIVDACMRRYSPTKLCDGSEMVIFLRFLCPVFFSEPRAVHFRPGAKFTKGRKRWSVVRTVVLTYDLCGYSRKKSHVRSDANSVANLRHTWRCRNWWQMIVNRPRRVTGRRFVRYL